MSRFTAAVGCSISAREQDWCRCPLGRAGVPLPASIDPPRCGRTAHAHQARQSGSRSGSSRATSASSVFPRPSLSSWRLMGPAVAAAGAGSGAYVPRCTRARTRGTFGLELVPICRRGRSIATCQPERLRAPPRRHATSRSSKPCDRIARDGRTIFDQEFRERRGGRTRVLASRSRSGRCQSRR